MKEHELPPQASHALVTLSFEVVLKDGTRKRTETKVSYELIQDCVLPVGDLLENAYRQTRDEVLQSL